jgi:hypothetical protein
MSYGGASVVTTSGGQPPDGNLERRVVAIEAVLPTLVTRADLVELRADIRIDNEKLRAELTISQDKLRAELTISQDKLRVEMEKLSVSLVKWMIATTLSLLVTFAALFIGLGNMLISRLAAPDIARTSVAVDAHSHAAPLENPVTDPSRLK